MSSPPLHERKAPLLTIFWRRFWFGYLCGRTNNRKTLLQQVRRMEFARVWLQNKADASRGGALELGIRFRWTVGYRYLLLLIWDRFPLNRRVTAEFGFSRRVPLLNYFWVALESQKWLKIDIELPKLVQRWRRSTNVSLIRLLVPLLRLKLLPVFYRTIFLYFSHFILIYQYRRCVCFVKTWYIRYSCGVKRNLRSIFGQQRHRAYFLLYFWFDLLNFQATGSLHQNAATVITNAVEFGCNDSSPITTFFRQPRENPYVLRAFDFAYGVIFLSVAAEDFVRL